MTIRRALVLAVVLCVGLWLLWPARDPVPQAFQPLSAALRGWESLEVVVGWPDGPAPEEPVTISVGPGRRGSVSSGGGGLEWEGGAVKVAIDGLSLPLMDATEQASDLYDELRDGFRGSDWDLIPAPRLGLLPIAPDATWASVRLPFDWAERTELLLAIDPVDGTLRYAALQGSRAPFTVQATPLRGGSRSVTLSSGALVRLPVRSISSR